MIWAKHLNLINQDKLLVLQSKQMAHGRINTTACNDLDDWYLDGFRVGKSFRSQRNVMFQQRVAYCKGSGPLGYQKNWERGFQVGIKS